MGNHSSKLQAVKRRRKQQQNGSGASQPTEGSSRVSTATPLSSAPSTQASSQQQAATAVAENTVRSNNSRTFSPHPSALEATQSSSKMSPPTTVPCQYRTGKTLGSGTYAIVKEAVHIKTGKYYACKVINKKLMEGREYMVRNEIAVLKKVSSGHSNIVTLYDYFETAHNLYLCFDLCTGGELFDRICARGNYYESDAAGLVRTIMKAVEYIHSEGIVHRDLKPENLIFRTPAEDADVMIADFGLSRIMDEDKLAMLTEVCGTPGYMAPEIFKKTGHGKPVDVWAMGVITYFLLAGYTPFDRESQQEEMEAIMRGDYRFEPEEYWANVSETAREFVRACLTVDPRQRPTATEALRHPWLTETERQYVPDPSDPNAKTDLLPHIQKHFDAKKTFRKAVFSMMAMKRMSMLSQAHAHAHEQHHSRTSLPHHVAQYKEESEKEGVHEETSVLHHHNADGDDHQHPEVDDIEVQPEGKSPQHTPIEDALAKATLDDLDARRAQQQQQQQQQQHSGTA